MTSDLNATFGHRPFIKDRREAASSLPSPPGEGFVRRYSFSTYACICSDNARKAVFSSRCLPHRGRLCPSVLFSTYACICSDNVRKAVFSFRCLPHWGRGTASAVDRVLSLMAYLRQSPSLSFIPLFPSNLRPFGAPPSIGRRVYTRKPLPLEGAAERSEAGLASFLGRRSGAFVNGVLETIFPTCLSYR